MKSSTKLGLSVHGLAFVFLLASNVIVGAKGGSTSVDLWEATKSFEFRDGVIVDTSTPAVYLMNLQRGIDAVDLSTGQLLWRTTNAAKPLLIRGRRLVAQAESPASDNQLHIVVLDVENGGKLLLSAAVQLPQGTQVRIDDGLGTTFRTSVHLRDDGAIVSWEYSKLEIGGPPPGPGAKALVAAGVVRIDLETGDAYPLGPDQVLPEPEPQLPERIVRLIETGALQGPLRKSGNVLGAIERIGGEGEHRTVLRRWQGGTDKPMPDVILSADGFTYRYASADGRHFLASKRGGAAKHGWIWRIYSLESGQPVAEVRNSLPGTRFFITASSLIYEAPPESRISEGGLVIEQPLRLRAIELTTSDELWEWPFRDTTYRGAYPPYTGRSGGL